MAGEENLRCDVIVVVAHPDDELLVSGTICLLADSGFRVALICATDGGGGSRRILPEKRNGELGRLRIQELHLSANILGVSEVILLGQEDPQTIRTPNWDRDAVVARVGAEITKHRPSLIITHGPKGGYGHPAHCLLNELVVQAAAKESFQGSCFSFCGATPGSFFSWHLDDPSTVIVDATQFLAQRSAALGYHQSQNDIFIQPHIPRSLRKFCSAAFGYVLIPFEVGRKRIPIGTPERFFSKYPREGLVLLTAPPSGGPHFFLKYYDNDPRVQSIA